MACVSLGTGTGGRPPMGRVAHPASSDARRPAERTFIHALVRASLSAITVGLWRFDRIPESYRHPFPDSIAFQDRLADGDLVVSIFGGRKQPFGLARLHDR